MPRSQRFCARYRQRPRLFWCKTSNVLFVVILVRASRPTTDVMISTFSPYRRAATGVSGAFACLIVVASGLSAHAQARLKAQYTISMTGVSIGQIVWLVDLGDNRYVTSAHGKASGVLSVLVNGEGSVVTHGVVADGELTPSYFTSSISDDEGKSELRMTFEDGAVKDMVGTEPPPQPDRVAVKEADRRGVRDPMSAMLIPAQDGGDALASWAGLSIALI